MEDGAGDSDDLLGAEGITSFSHHADLGKKIKKMSLSGQQKEKQSICA